MTGFWFEFDSDSHKSNIPYGLTIGCGVTAFDENDAFGILRELVFGSSGIPAIKGKIVDIDIAKLDQDHVIPNMRSPVSRGIWFPLGYSFD